MKKFFQQLTVFIGCLLAIMLFALYFIGSPEMSQGLLALAPVKNALLRKTPSPRIIFVGGSNLSHGLDSRKISETFEMPVVNMGLHGGLGLAYMLEEVRHLVTEDDLVVLAPEYNLYEDDGFWGNREVLGVVFDTLPEMRKRLTLQHKIRLLQFIPYYASKKILNSVLRIFKPSSNTKDVRLSFNEFGDYVGHWESKPKTVLSAKKKFKWGNTRLAIENLKLFSDDVDSKKGKLVLLPPCYQATSFDNQIEFIDALATKLNLGDLPLLAPMRRYRMEDSLFFDTNYHLTKQGIDIRTQLLIEDLKKMLP